MPLLRFYSAARLWPSLYCCVLFTAAFLLQSFCLLLLLVVLAPFILFIVRFFPRFLLAEAKFVAFTPEFVNLSFLRMAMPLYSVDFHHDVHSKKKTELQIK